MSWLRVLREPQDERRLLVALRRAQDERLAGEGVGLVGTEAVAWVRVDSQGRLSY